MMTFWQQKLNWCDSLNPYYFCNCQKRLFLDGDDTRKSRSNLTGFLCIWETALYWWGPWIGSWVWWCHSDIFPYLLSWCLKRCKRALCLFKWILQKGQRASSGIFYYHHHFFSEQADRGCAMEAANSHQIYVDVLARISWEVCLSHAPL